MHMLMTDTVNMTDSNKTNDLLTTLPSLIIMVTDFTVTVAYINLKLTSFCDRI